MAINQPITIFRGEDVQLRFTMSPVEDVTGWAVLLFVETDGCHTEFQGQVEDGPNGVFAFDIPAETTDGWSARKHRYDVWRSGGGLNEVLSAGPFIVRSTARTEGDDCP